MDIYGVTSISRVSTQHANVLEYLRRCGLLAPEVAELTG